MPVRIAAHILTRLKESNKLVIDTTKLFEEWTPDRHKQFLAELFELSRCDGDGVTINVYDETVTIHKRDIEILPE